MDHQEALALYDRYFAGSLDREVTRAFHAHLNGCEDCKVRLRATRASLVNPGFKRLSGSGQEVDPMKEILRRNRTMTYVIVVLMVCFLFFFKLSRLHF